MRLKRSFALFLTFLLVFSNLAFAAPVGAASNGKILLDQQSFVNDFIQNNVVETTQEGLYNPNDIVRIVVELEKEPAITYATEQGVRYKDLEDSVQAQLQEEVLASQEAVINSIESLGVTFEVEYNFTTVVNGFSTEVSYREYELIKNAPGVAEVHISNVYHLPEEQEPNMKYSLDLVKAMETWQDYGYDGEGMVIGIIDTGIDPWHADMALDEGVEIKLTEEIVNAKRAEHGLDGIFFTDKVPFGYNYMDKNTQILEQGPSISSHGMHVAGTVAANGEIMGVAPNAQLLALRVFGDDPRYGSTYGDIYVKSIDDAILLGADIVNLSLGSTAAFVRPQDPEQQAIARAVENGLIAAISAGNSAQFANALGRGNPFASNPDIGLTGSPSLSYDSIGVASFENSYLEMEGFAWTAGDEEGAAAFLASNNAHKALEGSVEVIHIVHNNNIDTLRQRLAETDVEGKIVMIQRGLPFIDKTLAVQDAGGAGTIVFNHSAGYTQMATDARIVTPQIFISKVDGEYLRDLLNAGTQVFIEFGGDSVVAPNPAAGQLSSFTSWGTTPNLDFKPELSAPGGNILSTIQGGGYGLKSGTSMAAPHVAGGSALVLQRVDEHFQLEGKARALKAKNILLNTSTIITDKSLYNNHGPFGLQGKTNPYSPRRQGSGLMDLHAAMQTPVVVTDVTTGEAKASLKEVGDTFSFTLQAENFGTEDVTYAINGNVQTDLVVGGRNMVEAQGVFVEGTTSNAAPWLGDYPISFSADEITVPAGGTVEFTVTVDLTNAVDWWNGASLTQLFPNGAFVEGFVTLTDVTEQFPTLALPYVSFYGEWDKAPIIDKKWYEPGFFHTWTGLFTQAGSRLTPVASLPGIEDVNNIFFLSPDGVKGVNPVLTFLRNAADVQYNILNADGDRLRTIKLEKDVRKNHGSPFYSYMANRVWDGTVNRQFVEDGLYYYEVKAKVDFPSAKWQSVKFPVLVDTTAPVVEIDYDIERGVINWFVTEEASGLASLEVVVNGNVTATVDVSTDRYEQAGTVNVSNLGAASTVVVFAVDRAGNNGVAFVQGINDNTVPYIYIDSPLTLTAWNTFEVPVSGHILEESDVALLTVNGVETELTYNEEENRFDFATTVTFDRDGAPDIFFEMTDVAGNTVGVKRQVIIDTTPPVLVIEDVANFVAGDKTVDLTVTVSDNFNELSLFVNGSQEYFSPLRAPYRESNFEENVTITVPITGNGTNVLTLELVDVAGNSVEEEVTIEILATVDSPLQNQVFNTLIIPVTGSVNDTSTEVKVDGQEVTLTGNEFTTSVTVDGDGIHEIDFEFVASNGKVVKTTRTVFVDTTAPVLVVEAPELTFDSEATLKISVKDNFDQINVQLNGETILNNRFTFGETPFEETVNRIVDLEVGKNEFEITVTDLAGNVVSQSVVIDRIADITTPAQNAVYNTSEVTVAGIVATGFEVSVNGESTDLVDGKLNTTVTFEEDGVHEVTFHFENAEGISESLVRTVLIDTTPAELTVDAPELTTNAEETLVINVSDNFDALQVHVNDEEVFSKAFVAPFEMRSIDRTVEHLVDLEVGSNTFTVKVTDVAGNVTEETVTIDRGAVSTPTPTPPAPAPTPPAPAPAPPAEEPKEDLIEVNFGDVSNHWAKKEIEYLAARGIIKGVSETSFAPNADITRAEFAALVTRVLGLETGSFGGSFSDVNQNAWYALEVEAAMNAGIVLGSGGKFNPNSKISREEMAVMIVRAYEFQTKQSATGTGSVQFADAASASAWAADAIKAANALGIVNGKTSTTFAPKDQATRAEAATMLYRLLGKF